MIRLLKGMRVVELASYMMGPIAGRVLADWGAEVIKVEPVPKQTDDPMDGDGDMIRGAGMSRGIVNGDPCVWQFVNGNKKSVCLDTHTPEGKQTMVDLCLSADVVISHLRHKDAVKLGVDYQSLSKRKKSIIVASTSGYGVTGRDADRGGFDAVAFAARSGMIMGMSPGGEPFVPYYGMGDVTSGTYLAAAILAAYVNKLETGEGEEVVTSLYGSAIWTAGVPVMTAPYGDPYPTSRKEQLPTANPFRCSDGKWIYIMGNVWRTALVGLCETMELPPDAKQRWPSYYRAMQDKEELVDLLDREFAKHPRDYWLEKLADTKIPCDVLADFEDVQKDPQAWEGGFLYRSDVEGYNTGIPLAPGQFTNAGKGEVRMNYPGDSTVEELKKIGYSEERIQSLLDRGIARQLDPETYEYDRFNIEKPGTTYNMVTGGEAM